MPELKQKLPYTTRLGWSLNSPQCLGYDPRGESLPRDTLFVNPILSRPLSHFSKPLTGILSSVHLSTPGVGVYNNISQSASVGRLSYGFCGFPVVTLFQNFTTRISPEYRVGAHKKGITTNQPSRASARDPAYYRLTPERRTPRAK